MSKLETKLKFKTSQIVGDTTDAVDVDAETFILEGTPKEIMNAVKKTTANVLAYHLLSDETGKEPNHDELVSLMKEIGEL
jgi:hypothetical protein